MRKLITILFAAGLSLAEDAPMPSLAEATQALGKAIEANSLPDAQKALSAVSTAYAKGTEDEQKEAVEAVGKAARAEDLTLRHAAFAALGAMKAKGSSRFLGRWLSPPKKFKGEIPLSYTEAIRAAGQIADPGTLATLQDLADHNDIAIAEVATTALGGFKELPTKRRKELALELCTRLEQLSALQRRKASEEVYERKAKLAAATTAALRGLTGKDYQTLEGWKSWKERAEKEANPFDS
jgi:HEAT repeat protein